MKSSSIIVYFILAFMTIQPIIGQSDEPKIVDIVWLKDGSKLRGTILKWDLERGMEFKLLTGAEIVIPRKEIHRVMQDIPLADGNESVKYSYIRPPKIYAFKEKGWYHNTSLFLHTSWSGAGAGFHHVMGYRFSRLFSIGLGTGLETYDFFENRDIIPVYAEARGFLLAKRITPYYALKTGYGFALKNENFRIIEARGGFHFSPEAGVRFGAGAVSYYLGLEYKLQNATFVSDGWDWSGGTRITDKISYRRFELRTGLLF